MVIVKGRRVRGGEGRSNAMMVGGGVVGKDGKEGGWILVFLST